jgi:hypothetical protein
MPIAHPSSRDPTTLCMVPGSLDMENEMQHACPAIRADMAKMLPENLLSRTRAVPTRLLLRPHSLYRRVDVDLGQGYAPRKRTREVRIVGMSFILPGPRSCLQSHLARV